MIVFDILVIIGGAVLLFPGLTQNPIVAAFIGNSLLDTSLKTIALGSVAALLLDLWISKGTNMNEE